MEQAIKLLDHGYLRFIEDWGRGDAGLAEAGIIEAARQSTQGSFRGWDDSRCQRCLGGQVDDTSDPTGCSDVTCPICNGTGIERGDQRLLAFLFNGKPQHATPFEFAGMTVEVQAPIAVFREWHRHRLQSYCETAFEECFDTLDLSGYNEMSARYAPLPDLNYVPTVERLLMVNDAGKNKQAGAIASTPQLTEAAAKCMQAVLQKNYEKDESDYQYMLKMGVAKELARLVLPVGRYSRMRATANLRNWLAFMTLRSDPNAQWEIRCYSDAIGIIISQRFPRTWRLFCDRRTQDAGSK